MAEMRGDLFFRHVWRRQADQLGGMLAVIARWSASPYLGHLGQIGRELTHFGAVLCARNTARKTRISIRAHIQAGRLYSNDTEKESPLWAGNQSLSAAKSLLRGILPWGSPNSRTANPRKRFGSSGGGSDEALRFVREAIDSATSIVSRRRPDRARYFEFAVYRLRGSDPGQTLHDIGKGTCSVCHALGQACLDAGVLR